MARMVFRGTFAAASLKQRKAGDPGGGSLPFPRYFCRGFIEAPIAPRSAVRASSFSAVLLPRLH